MLLREMESIPAERINKKVAIPKSGKHLLRGKDQSKHPENAVLKVTEDIYEID